MTLTVIRFMVWQ